MADDGKFGQLGLVDSNSQFNTTAFQIREALASVRTSIPVKIIAVHGGGVGSPPTVDVQPLVNMTDGVGDKTDNGIIYGIPVTRSQGASAAIINDPVVGDTGFMSIADRDISALKANEGGQSNPGSFRRHSMADGVYTGSMLIPTTPDRYVNLNGPGISLSDEFGNTISTGAGGITLNGVLIDRDGNIHAPGDIIALNGSLTFSDHVHSDVQSGSSTSGPPVQD